MLESGRHPAGYALRAFRNAFAMALTFMAAIAPAVAQSVGGTQGAPPDPAPAPVRQRMLSRDEGKAIVKALGEYEQQLNRKPDCSHLVHQVYRFAGFTYPYANSFDLYAGIEDFARVRAPQPGDLVVWRGHVGIVVDPRQRSFYSSVRAGLRTDYYNARHWRRRGAARFYRYLVGPADNILVATGPQPGSDRPVDARTVADVEESEEIPRGATANEPTVDVGSGVSNRAVRTRFEVPPSILVVTASVRPSAEEVAEAISELASASGNVFRGSEPLKPSVPVTVFDQLYIKKLEIKGERGWAHVAIDSRATIRAQKIETKQRREKVRWELRRVGSDWVAFTPRERLYVPRDVAAANLAAQLARLTQLALAGPQPDSLRSQQAQLARTLSTLLEQKR